MKRIIDSVSYNTDTATKIAFAQENDSDTDGITIKRMEWTLYPTRGGAFLLHLHEDELEHDEDGDAIWKRSDL